MKKRCPCRWFSVNSFCWLMSFDLWCEKLLLFKWILLIITLPLDHISEVCSKVQVWKCHWQRQGFQSAGPWSTSWLNFPVVMNSWQWRNVVKARGDTSSSRLILLLVWFMSPSVWFYLLGVTCRTSLIRSDQRSLWSTAAVLNVNFPSMVGWWKYL